MIRTNYGDGRTDEALLTLERARIGTARSRESAESRRGALAAVRDRIIGRSAVIESMFELMVRVAPTRANVLITGETGTGKELVAQAIHGLSDRARHPFVAINCSALPEALLESELFGHMRGSFTGAVATKRGLFEEAGGGTLFLDEISTLPAATQVKLLRVLQDRKLYRIGSVQPLSVDFRLVVATNVDLAEEVRAGRFREDLYYRLNVFPLRVPALRERLTDIPSLVEHFRLRCARENGVPPPDIVPGTLDRLLHYPWPGNVRELENYMERAVIMYAGTRMPFEPPESGTSRPERRLVHAARREAWSLERLEKEYILDVLQHTGGHRGQAAELLGIDRRTLYRKLKQYAREGRPVALSIG
jgi:two-component system, NtrC family, response regulator HydG